MPQKNHESTWIHSDRIPRPSNGTLDISEVDAFLSFLFSNLARRPPEINLRGSAAVARYLEQLGLQGVPRKILGRGEEAVRKYLALARTDEEQRVRACAIKLSEIVWGFLRQYGRFNAASNETAVRYLTRHSSSYLNNPYLKPVLDFVKNYDVPVGAIDSFKPPSLRSGMMSGTGYGKNYFSDDLSERVYAGYHALKRAGMKRPGPRVAEALGSAKVRPTKRRQGAHQDWLPQDVNERVKEHEKRLRAKAAKIHEEESKAEQLALSWRTQLVDKWLAQFRFHLQSEHRKGPN